MRWKSAAAVAGASLAVICFVAACLVPFMGGKDAEVASVTDVATVLDDRMVVKGVEEMRTGLTTGAASEGVDGEDFASGELLAARSGASGETGASAAARESSSTSGLSAGAPASSKPSWQGGSVDAGASGGASSEGSGDAAGSGNASGDVADGSDFEEKPGGEEPPASHPQTEWGPIT